MDVSETLRFNREQQQAFLLILERFVQAVKSLPPSELHARLLFYSEEAMDFLSSGLALDFSSLKYTLEQLFRLSHDPRVQVSLGDEMATLQAHWAFMIKQPTLN